MTFDRIQFSKHGGHRVISLMILCLFSLSAALAAYAPQQKKPRPKSDERVYLIHADALRYDMYSANPAPQILTGNVAFRQGGAHLTCDSAYFYQETNSVKAFGHVKFRQGDTLSLHCDRALYDGMQQIMQARHNVVLKHRRQTLYTDSLDYDRLYNFAFFQEGGKLVDGNDQLIADWGKYLVDTREAIFYYNVKLTNGERVVHTDTLHYDVRQSMAHVIGPSRIISKTSTIDTENAYFDTQSDRAQMYGRSTVSDKQKSIVGDTLFYDDKTGMSRGYGNVVYIDKENKNELHCEQMVYNEKTGYGFATGRALVKDYSQHDTLFVHADSLKLYTFNIGTDSVYRKAHCFRHVRAYRSDVQAVCDSLVFNSLDSCMTMYRDPIVWNANRQMLGEKIQVYMNDSTIRKALIIGQALSIEENRDGEHYNQVSSKTMEADFHDGVMRRIVCSGNVLSVYYPIDDKDSTLMAMNYLETDTVKMYLSAERKMEKIWTPKARGTWYVITQIPPSKTRLPAFAWFDNVRPKDKDDIFVWRGKGAGQELKTIKRHEAPLQHL